MERTVVRGFTVGDLISIVFILGTVIALVVMIGAALQALHNSFTDIKIICASSVNVEQKCIDYRIDQCLETERYTFDQCVDLVGK